jgi:diaminopimelate decarboxylase
LASPSQQPELLDIFPPGSRIDDDGELVVGGCRLSELAATWGTPLYVVDEGAVRANVRRFGGALAARRADSRMVFASKAFPCTAMYRLMASEGIGVDVAGAGELAMALAGGVDPALIVMHGNAKTTAELAMAVDAGVGLIVIDNEDDVDRLEGLVRTEQPVLLRVIPGVRPDTHEAVATGQAGSKFGLLPDDARKVIARLLDSGRRGGRLRLDGLHAHIGSQILATEPYARAVEAVARLGEFPVYNLGGGLGVRYTYGDRPPSLEDWTGTLAEAAHRYLPRGARLMIEPGRSLTAPFGVTVYTVVSVKGDEPRFVAVDGGMADNMEVALYGQRFEATLTGRVGGGDSVELVGRQCESGDKLISGVALRDPRPGDLVAVAVTGAYCYSLASNYNGAMRPPVVFCSDGQARLVVRRETFADFLSRDCPPLGEREQAAHLRRAARRRPAGRPAGCLPRRPHRRATGLTARIG